MDKFEWFKTQFASLSIDEQVEVFNKYCELTKCYEDEIYPMDEFNEMFSSYKPLEIARLTCSNSNYINFSDNYFVATYGSFKTFCNPYYYIEQYLSDVFDCKEAWESYISFDDFVHCMFVYCLYLQPAYMADDEFYDIVKKAASKYNDKSDIENAIKEILFKNVNEK